MSKRSGGRSIGPAIRSASASSAIVPALTTKVRIDPPTSTSRPAATNAASAAGLCISAAMIDVTISLASPRRSSDMLVSSSSATMKAPPTIGTASISLRLDSATNCTTTSGQLAAAISAPRFRAAFSPGVWAMVKHTILLAAPVYSRQHVGETTIGTPLLSRERRVSAARLFAAGCAAAALVVLAGFAYELYRFGSDDRTAATRLEASVLDAFGDMTADVQRVAHTVSEDALVRDAMAADPEDDDNARRLFDAASAARGTATDDESVLALTIYDNVGVPRAWAGRASDLPADRTKGGAAVFVTSTPLGLRLIFLEPIAAKSADRARVGAVAVERAVAIAPAVASIGTAVYTMPSPLGPVTLRVPQRAGAPADP